MGQTHNYAFVSSLPITGADITAAAVTWAACRIVGDISHTPSYRKKLEDENEEGELVGEKHFDLEEKITLTLGIVSTFVIPAKNSVVVIAGSDAPVAAWNGNWQLDEIGPTFKSGDRAEVKITLRRNENLTLTP